jgi:carbonic anhydrase/acetyltransferase-like protein (isoleucine patch superfamily)
MSEHPKNILTLEELKKTFPHRYHSPKIEPSVFVAPGSHILGDVTIAKESSVWFNCVIRGDVNYIRIGERTNIQDMTLIHESYQKSPTLIGNSVTVGHSVVLHACTIGDFCLVGMGSVILDEAELGDYVLLGAGSLVTQGTKIPPRSKAFGRPAKVVGKLTDEEIRFLKHSADHYVRLRQTYL